MIEYTFNGVLYLIRDTDISDQYLGSGKTLHEAYEEMEKTIIDHNLRRLKEE